MRNVPNTYIFSLALGDLLVIITCVPFTSTIYTLESWPFGDVICRLSEYFKDVSIGVSVFTLTSLSAERYCVIVNPIRSHVGGGSISSRSLTLLIAVGIWLLAVLLALPAALFSSVQTRRKDNGQTILFCSPFPPKFGQAYKQMIVLSKFLVYYAIPLSVIACFYVLMARHLEYSTRNMPGELQGQSTQVLGRRKVAKMVLSFVFIFIVCFLPIHIFMLWFHFSPDAESQFDEYWNAFRIFAFCMSFINSCINPVALYCVSGTFRKHFNQYLLCCCRELSSNGTNYETSTHTMVHFSSTTRRHLLKNNTTNIRRQHMEDVNCSCSTTSTTLEHTS
uniref:G-protein coupled receptors family 1 profile domain-containing protein n=1 Tax=Timema genevievae TaxID=629358 RepID=A0A7R9JYH0_TIMGE|nr:unnamed protein product [Timema genevievae]